MTTRTASCCCGASTITVVGPENFSAICHCNNCKRRTGSAFGVSVYFGEEQVVEASETTSIYATSNDNGSGERHFCTACGTTLYWRGDMFPNMVGIAGGCFPEAIEEPKISGSHEQRLSWVQVPDSWTLC